MTFNCDLPREEQVKLIKDALACTGPSKPSEDNRRCYDTFEKLKHISPAIVHSPVKFTGAYNKYGAKYSH